jgi:hypothetical protein
LNNGWNFEALRVELVNYKMQLTNAKLQLKACLQFLRICVVTTQPLAIASLAMSASPQTKFFNPDVLLKLTGALLLMAVFTFIGTALDDRLVVGQVVQANVWAKPLKFQLSMTCQLLTVWWALGYLKRNGSPVPAQAIVIGALVLTVLFEASYITLQGARGLPSHFSRVSAIERFAGSLMAVGAYVLVSTSAWIGGVALWRWARQTPSQRDPMLLAIGMGFVLTFALAGWTGSALGQYRGPFVQAVPPIGITLPLTLWRLDVGDLRISHFMGNHAMQALPLLAWTLANRSAVVRHAAVTGAALAWSAATVWLLERALSNTGFL